MSVVIVCPPTTINRITVDTDGTDYTLHLVPEGKNLVARVTNGKPGRPLDVAILGRAEAEDLLNALAALLAE